MESVSATASTCSMVRSFSKYDARWAVSACLIIAFLVVTNLAKGIEALIGIPQETVSMALKLFIACALAGCLPSFMHVRIPRRMIFILTATFFIAIIQAIAFSQSWDVFKETLLTFLMTALPFSICVLMIDDKELLLKKMVTTGVVVSAIVFFFMLLLGGNAFADKYSMGFSAALVVPTNAMLIAMLNPHETRYKRVLLGLLVVSNVFAILAYGSRGALLAILLFFCLVVFKSGKRSRRSIIALSVFCVVVLIFGLFLDDFLLSLSNTFENLGFHSRSLNLLTTDVSYDSGRSVLWAILGDQLALDPLSIRGINADYLAIGIYSHNIFLELFYEFGILLGFLAALAIVGLTIREIRADFDSDARVSLLIMSGWFPILLFSGSLWTNIFFWGWLIAFKGKNCHELR